MIRRNFLKLFGLALAIPACIVSGSLTVLPKSGKLNLGYGMPRGRWISVAVLCSDGTRRTGWMLDGGFPFGEDPTITERGQYVAAVWLDGMKVIG